MTEPAFINRFDVAGVALVVDQLKAIQHEADRRDPLRRNDGVACFDYLYTKITENVLRCVQPQGVSGASGASAVASVGEDPVFKDQAFMSCLDVAFANRYLAAMGVGGPKYAPPFQPRCWQTLLDHRETRDISPLVFAVAGVNNHVNFDLPFALVTACTVMGCELDSGSNRDDYEGINTIFANHMQQLRQHFEDRFTRDFDKGWVSSIENKVGDFLVVATRDMAWRTAERLWRHRHDEATLLRMAKACDRRVALVNWCMFQVDRLPAMVYRGLRPIPGPTRAMACRGLRRTGWGEPTSSQAVRPPVPARVG